MSLKETIRAAADRPREFVATPEWEITGVWVGTLSGRERDQFDQELVRRKTGEESVDLTNLRAVVVALTAQDEDGARVFDLADAEWLGDKSAEVLSRVYDVAVRLNKLSAGDAEQAVKNS
jgi:hypothetical protein